MPGTSFAPSHAKWHISIGSRIFFSSKAIFTLKVRKQLATKDEDEVIG